MSCLRYRKMRKAPGWCRLRLSSLGKGDAVGNVPRELYKDAVIMLPLSKIELDQLVQMMSANPNYRIRFTATPMVATAAAS